MGATGSVVRSEIPRQSYVLYNKTTYTFRVVEKYFREEGMVLNTVIELGSMEATKELVKLGLGGEHHGAVDCAQGIGRRVTGGVVLGQEKAQMQLGHISMAQASSRETLNKECFSDFHQPRVFHWAVLAETCRRILRSAGHFRSGRVD